MPPIGRGRLGRDGSVRRDVPGAERLGDALRDPLARRRGADADGMLDHAPLRAAVGDDHGAPDAQQRRSADDLVVERPCGCARCRGAAAGRRAGPGSPLRNSARNRSKMKAGQALEELDHDVAQDRVADDDVGELRGQVLALDVADEVEVRLVDAAPWPAGSARRPCPSPRRSTAGPPAAGPPRARAR